MGTAITHANGPWRALRQNRGPMETVNVTPTERATPHIALSRQIFDIWREMFKASLYPDNLAPSNEQPDPSDMERDS